MEKRRWIGVPWINLVPDAGKLQMFQVACNESRFTGTCRGGNPNYRVSKGVIEQPENIPVSDGPVVSNTNL